MGGLVAIEDFLITTTKGVFGKRLKTVDHLPGQWGADALRRMATVTPCVYFAYLGGGKDKRLADRELCEFHVYVFTGSAADEKQRRRGDLRAIGAYQIVDILAAQLDELEVPDEDALKWIRTDNLFDDFIHANGLTAYRLKFELLRHLPPKQSPDQLGDFLQLYATYDPAAPNAQDQVQIPQ